MFQSLTFGVMRFLQRRWAVIALWALIVFHGGILFRAITTGDFLDPVTAAKWIAGALLFLGFVRLHRSGISVLRGRSALAMWVLVLLLHVIAAPVPVVEPAKHLVLPTVIVLGTLVLLTGAATLLAADRESSTLIYLAFHYRPSHFQLPVGSNGIIPSIANRPPPSLSAFRLAL